MQCNSNCIYFMFILASLVFQLILFNVTTFRMEEWLPLVGSMQLNYFPFKPSVRTPLLLLLLPGTQTPAGSWATPGSYCAVRAVSSRIDSIILITVMRVYTQNTVTTSAMTGAGNMGRIVRTATLRELRFATKVVRIGREEARSADGWKSVIVTGNGRISRRLVLEMEFTNTKLDGSGPEMQSSAWYLLDAGV
jgi:hypothetical protein